MTELSSRIPTSNITIYELLYTLEVGLREFIIEKLGKTDPRWWKQRLPSDVLSKSKLGITEERKVRWIQLIPHHPLYYIDFPDLRKIIERTDNWRETFQGVFADKDVLDGILRELEPIRNKVAHNRKTTRRDEDITLAAYQAILSAIGEDVLLSLVDRQSIAHDVPALLQRLLDEAVQSFDIIQALRPLDGLSTWEIVKESWWFDSEYLGHSIDGIKDYFRLLADYAQLPRYRGVGHVLEEWFQSQQLALALTQVRAEISNLINDARG